MRCRIIWNSDTRCFVISVSSCLLYTSDAADEEDSVDLGGRRIIKKKKETKNKGSDDKKTEIKEKARRRGTKKRKIK